MFVGVLVAFLVAPVVAPVVLLVFVVVVVAAGSAYQEVEAGHLGDSYDCFHLPYSCDEIPVD